MRGQGLRGTGKGLTKMEAKAGITLGSCFVGHYFTITFKNLKRRETAGCVGTCFSPSAPESGVGGSPG